MDGLHRIESFEELEKHGRQYVWCSWDEGETQQCFEVSLGSFPYNTKDNTTLGIYLYEGKFPGENYEIQKLVVTKDDFKEGKILVTEASYKEARERVFYPGEISLR